MPVHFHNEKHPELLLLPPLSLLFPPPVFCLPILHQFDCRSGGRCVGGHPPGAHHLICSSTNTQFQPWRLATSSTLSRSQLCPANFVFLAFLLHCLVTTHHFLLLTDSPQAESFLCLILLFSYLWNLTQQLVPPTHPVKPQRSSIEAPASVAPLPVSHLHSGIYHKDLLYL